MYVKIFEQIFDSSIAEDWQTRHVFEDLLKLADATGIVDMTPQSIARRTNIPLEIVTDAIAKLEAPDPMSRSPDHDGRRLIRLDATRKWGWSVVNWQKYRDIRNADERREYLKQAKRRSRSTNVNTGQHVSTGVNSGQHVSTPVNTGQQMSTMSTYVEAEAFPLRDPTEGRGKNCLESKTLTDAQVVLYDKEHQRINREIAAVLNQYEGHQEPDSADRAKLKKLRGRRRELRDLLGITT